MMGLKCKRPSCCCCTLTLPLQNERATKTLSFSSGSTCSFKNTLFLLAGFCLLSEFLERERERMSYEEKERDGGNDRDKHTESIRVFGDYYACVFRQLCLCGLKFKEEVDYVQVELLFLFLKFYYLILNSCFVLLFFT